MRLINADALKDRLHEALEFQESADNYEGAELFEIAKDIADEQHTIDAIPVEWLKQWRDKLKGMGDYQRERAEDISFVLGLWQKEQEDSVCVDTYGRRGTREQ